MAQFLNIFDDQISWRMIKYAYIQKFKSIPQLKQYLNKKFKNNNYSYPLYSDFLILGSGSHENQWSDQKKNLDLSIKSAQKFSLKISAQSSDGKYEILGGGVYNRV